MSHIEDDFEKVVQKKPGPFGTRLLFCELVESIGRLLSQTCGSLRSLLATATATPRASHRNAMLKPAGSGRPIGLLDH